MAHVNARRDEASARTARPRLERSRDDRMLAGVAGGIGRHLGLSSNLVRVALVASAFAAGFGIIVYVLTWLLAPLEPAVPATSDADAVAAPAPATRFRMPSVGQVVGIGAVRAVRAAHADRAAHQQRA